MSEFLSSWLFELGKVSVFLAVVAMIIGVTLRYARPTSPQLHRAAWCLVLLVGWLFVRLPISIPWYESIPQETSVADSRTAETEAPDTPAPSEVLPALVTLEDTVKTNDATQDQNTETIELYTSAPAAVESENLPAEPLIAIDAVEQPVVAMDDTPVTEIETTAMTPAAPEEPILTTTPPSVSQPISASVASSRLADWLVYWPYYLLAVWLLGMAILLLRWLAGYVHSIRSMSTALEPDAVTLRNWQNLLQQHRVKHDIPVRLTKNMGPLLCRWPDGYELVIPQDFWESLTPVARMSVMRHELEHYRRGDVWKSLAMRVLALPHWFNPASWWAVRRFDEAAEWACDEAAVGNEARTTDYARTLLMLAESSLGGGSCHPSMSRWNLPARIRRLVTTSHRKDSFMKKMTLLMLAMFLLAICLVRIDLVAKTPPSPALPMPETEVADTSAPNDEETIPETPVDLKDEAPLTTGDASEKKDATASKAIRYDGKTFDEWKEIIATDTSPKQLGTAMHALVTIGSAQGDLKAAAEASIPLLRKLGVRHFSRVSLHSEVHEVPLSTMAFFLGNVRIEKVLYGTRTSIPYEIGIPILCRELEEGNDKSRAFVLCAFEQLLGLGPRDKAKEQAVEALNKFLESDAPESLRKDAANLLTQYRELEKARSNPQTASKQPDPKEVHKLGEKEPNVVIETEQGTLKADKIHLNLPQGKSTLQGPAKSLHYNGKTFDEWKTVLTTEVDPGQLTDAIKALGTLSARERGPEAAEAILKLMRVYGARYSFQSIDKSVMDAATLVFFGRDRGKDGSPQKVSYAIPIEKGLTALCSELQNGNEKSRRFVLGVFARMLGNPPQTRHTFLIDEKDVDLARRQIGEGLAKFIKSDASEKMRHDALKLLAYQNGEKFVDVFPDVLKNTKDPQKIAWLINDTRWFDPRYAKEARKISVRLPDLQPPLKKLLSILDEQLDSTEPVVREAAIHTLLSHLRTLTTSSILLDEKKGSARLPLQMTQETSQLLKSLTWRTVRYFTPTDEVMLKEILNGRRRHTYSFCNQSTRHGPDFVSGPQNPVLYRFIIEASESDDELLSKQAKTILAEIKQIDDARKAEAAKSQAKSQAAQKSTKKSTKKAVAFKTPEDARLAKLRYQGKSFDEWVEILHIDLSVDTQAEAVKALAAFGSQGYGKKSAEVIAKFMRQCGGGYTDGTDRTKVLSVAFSVFVDRSKGPKRMDDLKYVLAYTLPVKDTVPVLGRELKEGNSKSQAFVLTVLGELGEEAKDATPAVAEFIKSQKDDNADSESIRRRAFTVLLSIDPDGKTTSDLVQKELEKDLANCSNDFVRAVTFRNRFLTTESNPVTPGIRGAISTLCTYIHSENVSPGNRFEVMKVLARFLTQFETELSVSSFSGRFIIPLTEKQNKFLCQTLGHLQHAWVKADSTQQQELMKILQLPPNVNICKWADAICEESEKAFKERPSDISIVENKKVANEFYEVLRGRPYAPSIPVEITEGQPIAELPTMKETVAKATKKPPQSSIRRPAPNIGVEIDSPFTYTELNAKTLFSIAVKNNNKVPLKNIKVEVLANRSLKILAASAGHKLENKHPTWVIETLNPRVTKKFEVQCENVSGEEEAVLRARATAPGNEEVGPSHGEDRRRFEIILPALPAEKIVPLEGSESDKSSSQTLQQNHDLIYQVVGEKVDPSTLEDIQYQTEERIKIIVPAAKVFLERSHKLRIALSTKAPKTIERVDRMITRPGTLEFRILANEHDHKDLIERAKKSKDDELIDEDGNRLAWWVPLLEDRVEEFKKEHQKAPLRTTTRPDGTAVTEALVVNDPYNVNDKMIEDARMERGPNEEFCPCYVFNKEGAKRFGQLTGDNLPDEANHVRRQLCMILDERIYSAPYIMSRISRHGMINGNFTEEEAKEIVHILKTGSLPAPLKRVMLPPAPQAALSKALNSKATPSGEGPPSIEVVDPNTLIPSEYRFKMASKLPPELSSPFEQAPRPADVGSVNRPLQSNYRIEPSDLLRIELNKIVPKQSYKLEAYDVLQINAIHTLLEHPINGYFMVEWEGTINLGPAYGRVKVIDMTMDEAEKTLETHLKKTLRDPKVSASLARGADMSIKNDYKVGLDGTIHLKRYGLVHVAGETIAEATKQVQEKLSEHLKSPVVSMDLVRQYSKFCYVIIKNANENNDYLVRVHLTGNETLLDVMRKISVKFPSKERIQIVRQGSGKQKTPSILEVQWLEVMYTNPKAREKYRILPNDRIVVFADSKSKRFTENRIADLFKSSKPAKHPHEGAMTLLPEYRIEPPDVIGIDLAKLVPKKYEIAPDDELQITAINTLVAAPINDYYKVDAHGRVALGPAYGTVKVGGLSIAEAEEAVARHLKTVLKNPSVSVQLAYTAGCKPVNGTYLVGPDGAVNMRDYGAVNVSGKTIKEAKEAIEKQLSKILADPCVNVTMSDNHSKVFYVIKKGNDLGDNVTTYEVTGKETVLDAICYINRSETLSKETSIWIERNAKDGTTEKLNVDYNAVMTGLDTRTNYQLFPGDRLYIQPKPQSTKP